MSPFGWLTDAGRRRSDGGTAAGIIRRRLRALLKRLLNRLVLIHRSGLIGGVPTWRRWLRFRTGIDKENRKEREQDRLFHKELPRTMCLVL